MAMLELLGPGRMRVLPSGIDVIDDGITGSLHEDLATAAVRALSIDPHACRKRAERSGWDVCSREFESNLTAVKPSSVAVQQRRRVAVDSVAN